MMIKNIGFTLIELIVTLAIAAILITVAGPNFLTFIKNNRLTAQANSMVGSLQLARSEAVKRDKTVTVCRSDSPTVSLPALPDCNTGTNWKKGWIVFVDNNSNGDRDAGETTILQQHEALSGGNNLFGSTSTNVKEFIVFKDTGFVKTGSDGTLALCDDRGKSDGIYIDLGTTGHISSIKIRDVASPPRAKTCTPA